MISRIRSSKKGASSIMVMLMLVVLVVFGIAALTTALSNMRLGQKVVDWNEKYYAAEKTANERYAMIDKAIEDARGSGGTADGVQRAIDKLGFKSAVAPSGNALIITYETWSGDIGISSILSVDLSDGLSLHTVQWKEIQK